MSAIATAAIEWNTKVQEFTKAQIGKCKVCKTIVGRELTVTRTAIFRSDRVGAVSDVKRFSVAGAPAAPRFCACGKAICFEDVRGKVSEEPCGAKCMNSTGLSCECSCGGKNHGCGHA